MTHPTEHQAFYGMHFAAAAEAFRDGQAAAAERRHNQTVSPDKEAGTSSLLSLSVVMLPTPASRSTELTPPAIPKVRFQTTLDLLLASG